MTPASSAAAPRIGWSRAWLAPHLRRRALAAVLAAAAVLLAVGSFGSADPVGKPKPAVGAPSHQAATHLAPGLVADPVRLADPGLTLLLYPGMTVDVLAATDSPTGPADAVTAPARVVAHGARVLAVPATSAVDAAGGTLVLLAVSSHDAQVLAGAQAGGRLSVTIGTG